MAKRADGSLEMIDLRDLDGDGRLDLAIFEGAASGLLAESDLTDAAPVIEPGSAAAILLFENRWATGFVQELRRGGAELSPPGISRRTRSWPRSTPPTTERQGRLNTDH